MSQYLCKYNMVITKNLCVLEIYMSQRFDINLFYRARALDIFLN